MKRIICFFLGHRYRLFVPSGNIFSQEEYYQCQRCGKKEHYYF